MKKNYLLVVIAALAFSSLVALADDPGKDGGDGKGGQPGSQRQITIDEFKFRCEHPEQTDIQRAPQNIRIQCTDIHRAYVADAPGTVALPGQEQVSATLFSDKFNVNTLSKGANAFQDSGSCLRFKEIEQTLTVERPLSCAEITGMKGDIDDFCSDYLATEKGVNPKLVDSKETGTVVDTCNGITKGGKGGASN